MNEVAMIHEIVHTVMTKTAKLLSKISPLLSRTAKQAFAVRLLFAQIVITMASSVAMSLWYIFMC